MVSQRFKNVKKFSPPASRKNSSEIYVIGRSFQIWKINQDRYDDLIKYNLLVQYKIYLWNIGQYLNTILLLPPFIPLIMRFPLIKGTKHSFNVLLYFFIWFFSQIKVWVFTASIIINKMLSMSLDIARYITFKMRWEEFINNNKDLEPFDILCLHIYNIIYTKSKWSNKIRRGRFI